MKTSRLLFLAAAWSLLFAAGLGAQDVEKIARILKEKPPAPAAAAAAPESAAPAAPATPLLYLRDGSKVAGVPRLDVLEVETRYGTLKIPTAEITRVRFARRLDPALEKKVNELIQQLGDEDFDRRENAMLELRKIKLPALAGLRAATNSANEELKNRAKLLVEEFEEWQKKNSTEKDSMPHLRGSDDEIVTDRMTIRGRVLAEDLVVDSRYGELAILVADLQGITFRRPSALSRRLQIAPSYQPPNNWLDTEMAVEKGQSLKIEAGGIISVSNYNVSSNPAGTQQWGGSSFGGFPMLSLIGKIGKNGKPFLVGTQHKSKPRKTGDLYLAVVPFSHYPQGASGSYQVKINISGGE
jgi:hypothetical protein